MIATQITGKDSAVNGGLFRLKERLALFGFAVRHPLAAQLVHHQDAYFTYNPKHWTEYEVWLDCFESITTCDVHIVSNDVSGLVGREGALSLSYALLHNKPIILTNKPYFKPEVEPCIARLIQRRVKRFNTQNLLKLDNPNLKPYIEIVASQQPRYGLNRTERTIIRQQVRAFLNELL